MTHAAGRSAASRQVEMFGRYRLLGRLAIGGMAEVWAAQLLAAGGFCKSMVIKRMLPELTSQPTFLKMLMQEARVAARLSHTNVCAVFELGEVSGEYYIAMEYLRGCALTQVLRSGAGVAPATAVAIIAQACDGLHYAHEQRDASGAVMGLVHRDVSPHNLFVTVDGVVKVLDFGIAKVDDGQSDRTEAGKVKGKLPYMSPEQLAAQQLDRRSDVWSLGVVLWELLAGKRLFGGASPAFTVDAIRNARVPTLASVGVDAPRLDDVLAKALCRSREWRYSTAAELRAAMVAAIAEAPAQAPVLTQLVWDRAAPQISAHDKLFEQDDLDADGEANSGVVQRLPLRADATQPSYEHVDLLDMGTTALSSVLDSFDPGARSGRVSPTEPTRILGVTPSVNSPAAYPVAVAHTDPAASGVLIAPPPSPTRSRRGLWAVVVLLMLAVGAGVALLLMREPGGEPVPVPVAEVTPPAPAIEEPTPPPVRVDEGPTPVPVPVVVVAVPEPTPEVVTPKPAAPKPKPKKPEPRPQPKVVAPKLAPGKLTIDARPWATIYLDGKKLGATPIVGLAIPAGDHTIKAVAEDGTTKTMSIRVEPGGEVRKKVTW